MTSLIAEKRSWSSDGQFILTRLVFNENNSTSAPAHYEVKLNKKVLYYGYDYNDAAAVFHAHEEFVG